MWINGLTSLTICRSQVQAAWRPRGRVSAHQSRNLAVPGSSLVLTITKLELFHGSPEFKSSAALVNGFPGSSQLTCSFQKMIQTLAFRGQEKFNNSF